VIGWRATIVPVTDRTRDDRTIGGLRSNEIAELRHRDASKREGRRVVAQGDPLQCTEGIARHECTRRDRNQRVHRNPVTLVTAIVNPPKRINALSLCAEKRWHNHPRQLPRAILNALDTHDAAELEGNDLRLLVVRHE
jgi:hypothetical protein